MLLLLSFHDRSGQRGRHGIFPSNHQAVWRRSLTSSRHLGNPEASAVSGHMKGQNSPFQGNYGERMWGKRRKKESARSVQE